MFIRWNKENASGKMCRNALYFLVPLCMLSVPAQATVITGLSQQSDSVQIYDSTYTKAISVNPFVDMNSAALANSSDIQVTRSHESLGTDPDSGYVLSHERFSFKSTTTQESLGINALQYRFTSWDPFALTFGAFVGLQNLQFTLASGAVSGLDSVYKTTDGDYQEWYLKYFENEFPENYFCFLLGDCVADANGNYLLPDDPDCSLLNNTCTRGTGEDTRDPSTDYGGSNPCATCIIHEFEIFITSYDDPIIGIDYDLIANPLDPFAYTSEILSAGYGDPFETYAGTAAQGPVSVLEPNVLVLISTGLVGMGLARRRAGTRYRKGSQSYA